MSISVRPVSFQEILPCRDLYRQEMNCQIIHDSLHVRPGWTQAYLLTIDGQRAGYASVAKGGPWKSRHALFEYYVLPHDRHRMFDLFDALLPATTAVSIDVQSNDPILTPMLHAFAREVKSEAILFHDRLTTTLPSYGALLRKSTPADDDEIRRSHLDNSAEWVLSLDGMIVGTGGVLFHYNRPYGDLYMSVAESHRRRGLGSYLVQELKNVCYQGGSVPAARCNPGNIASRGTLQKAGLVPCGHMLVGSLPGSTGPETPPIL